MPGELDLAREVIDRLGDLPSSLRQLTVDSLWARIPNTIAEGVALTVANANAGKPITINRQTDQLEKITGIVAICATGGATLSLGNDQRWTSIPLVAGVNNLGPGMTIILSPSDPRTVTPAQGGALWVLLCGEQMPNAGIEAP